MRLKMAAITFSIVSVALVGCGAADVATATITGYSTHCIDNVRYVQFRNGASVMYNSDGTIQTCGKSSKGK